MSIASSILFIAQATPATSQPAPGWATFLSSPLFPMVLVGAVFLYMMSRSKKTEAKQRENLLSSLKRADRVQTIGGILANVVEVRDDRVLLKVDEGSNTKIWFSRSAIHRIVTDDKVEAVK